MDFPFRVVFHSVLSLPIAFILWILLKKKRPFLNVLKDGPFDYILGLILFVVGLFIWYTLWAKN
jgi:hypothetical protein